MTRYVFAALILSSILASAERARACIADEVCADGVDDDCDGSTDESACRPKEICCNGIDDDADGRIDEYCGACVTAANVTGGDVSGASKQARVGPYSLAHIRSDQGGRADIDFEVLYDSAQAKADFADDTATSCTTNADCGEGRGCDTGTGTCMVSSVDELPYTRIVGPGFRHTFDDRLIIDKNNAGTAQVVTWERLGVPEQFTLFSGNVWHSEPGTHEILEQSGTTWRLLTDDGDLLEFAEPATPSILHPAGVADQKVSSGALATTSTHARLKKIFPLSAPNRFVRLLYEGDTTGSGPEQVPTAVCAGMPAFGANPAGSCYAARGLLVKIGTVLDSNQHGPSIELQYTRIAATGSLLRDQYLLWKVSSGTDRVDGVTISTFASVSFSSAATVRQLSAAYTLLNSNTLVADVNALAKFAYGSPAWELTEVDRPVVNSAGSLAVVPQEMFTWTAGLITAHSRPGQTVTSTTAPYSSSMTWYQNGMIGHMSLDGNGNPTDCSTGSCGINVAYETTASGYTLGPSAMLGVDASVWHAFAYTDPTTTLTRGPVLVCELVSTTTLASPPSCTLTGDVATWDTRTTPRRLERRYYDSLGRLRAQAVYDVDTALTTTGSVTFPHQTNLTTSANPFSSGGASSSTIAGACDTLTTSFAGGYFDVTSFDYDSNGNGLSANSINEGTSATSLFAATVPDMAPVRVIHAAKSASNGQQSECDVFERGADSLGHNGRGDVVLLRSYEGSTLLSQTDLGTVFAVTAGNTSSNDRVKQVTRYRNVTTSPPSDSIVTSLGCTTGAFDDEGRLVCFSVPQSTGPSISVTEASGSPGLTPVFSYRRVTTVSGGTTTKTSYADHLAWGPIYQRGLGDDVSGGAAEGNFMRFLRDATSGDANKATSVSLIEHRDSNGGILDDRTFVRDHTTDPFGRVTETQTHNGTSAALRKNLMRQIDDRGTAGQDRVKQSFDVLTVSPLTGISTYFDYQDDNWDALQKKTEGDGDIEEYTYGTSGNEAGRLTTVGRGASSPTTPQQMFTYTQDGLLYQNFNAPHSTSVPIATYAYDALRRLKQETRASIGQNVTYAYRDAVHISERMVLDASSVMKSDVVTGYDGLGRELLVLEAQLPTTLRTYKWDEKGNATYETATPPGRSYTLDSQFNRGHLAYVEDQEGATFFRYDAAGRVISIVRHDGALSGFSTTKLSAIDFTYANATTQELSSITYPSGVVVTYGYGNDKERPSSVSTTSGSFVALGLGYEPSGAPIGWYWQGLGTQPHVETRDLLGRTTQIIDYYLVSGIPVVWSNVNYTYDGDGDVLSENDVTSYTWLSHTTTANKTRTYGYAPSGGENKDLLGAWADDGAVEENKLFLADGRVSQQTHGNYAYHPTYWERRTSMSGGSISATINYVSNGAGLVSSIAWSGGITGTTTFGYGKQLETTTVTTGAGTYTSSYDFDMRRVKRVDPTGNTIRFRYGFGRQPFEEKRTQGTSTQTYDTVFFAGEPIAQIVTTTNPAGGPVAYHLHTDRMGNVRKISSTTGTHVQRIFSDAWGYANTGGGTACPVASPDCVADSTPTPAPSWMWRYPGQYVDAGNVFNNGWRDYVPELGIFTSPDALLALKSGVQGFGYAQGRPMANIDPDGRIAVLTVVDEANPDATTGPGGPIAEGEDESSAAEGEGEPEPDEGPKCILNETSSRIVSEGVPQSTSDGLGRPYTEYASVPSSKCSSGRGVRTCSNEWIAITQVSTVEYTVVGTGSCAGFTQTFQSTATNTVHEMEPAVCSRWRCVGTSVTHPVDQIGSGGNRILSHCNGLMCLQ